MRGAGGVADLKYAYDWEWSPPWPDANKKFPAPWEPERSDPRELGWPDDPGWLPHTLHGTEGADALPATSWGNEGARVGIVWEDQSDSFLFSQGDDGRTRFVITRGGKAIASVR